MFPHSVLNRPADCSIVFTDQQDESIPKLVAEFSGLQYRCFFVVLNVWQKTYAKMVLVTTYHRFSQTCLGMSTDRYCL
eukprot:SAG11_NODE_93_length_17080_cov_10.504093_20_plen_78_part_00